MNFLGEEMSFAKLEECGKAGPAITKQTLSAMQDTSNDSDTALIMYTSGSTGLPKASIRDRFSRHSVVDYNFIKTIIHF